MSERILAGLCLLLFCATATAEPSVAPLVKFPEGDFTCTVEVAPHSRPPRPDPAHPERPFVPVIDRIVITQVGNIRCDEFHWSDNNRTHVWTLIDENVSIEESGKASRKSLYVLRGGARNTVCPPLLNFDAKSVSWITPQTLQVDSDKVLHYKETLNLSTIADRPRIVDYHAWIDPKTLLPVKFDDGDAVYVLNFSPDPPGTQLVLPDRMRAELDRYRQLLAPHAHR